MNAAAHLPAASCPDCGDQTIVTPNNFKITRGHVIGRISFKCGWSGSVSAGPIYRCTEPCAAKPKRSRPKPVEHRPS